MQATLKTALQVTAKKHIFPEHLVTDNPLDLRVKLTLGPGAVPAKMTSCWVVTHDNIRVTTSDKVDTILL